MEVAMLYALGTGRYQNEFGALWDRLVPDSGQAPTVQGELVRAIGRLASEAYRNGNLNWDDAFDTFVAFLSEHLCRAAVFEAETTAEIRQDLKEIQDAGRTGSEVASSEEGEDAYDRVINRVVEWCQRFPGVIPRPNNPLLRR